MTILETEPGIQKNLVSEIDPLSLDGEQLLQHIAVNGLTLNLGQITHTSSIERVDIIERQLQRFGLLGLVTIQVGANEDQTGIAATFRLRQDA